CETQSGPCRALTGARTGGGRGGEDERQCDEGDRHSVHGWEFTILICKPGRGPSIFARSSAAAGVAAASQGEEWMRYAKWMALIAALAIVLLSLGGSPATGAKGQILKRAAVGQLRASYISV